METVPTFSVNNDGSQCSRTTVDNCRCREIMTESAVEKNPRADFGRRFLLKKSRPATPRCLKSPGSVPASAGSTCSTADGRLIQLIYRPSTTLALGPVAHSVDFGLNALYGSGRREREARLDDARGRPSMLGGPRPL
jgi:hypothetical protein